MTTTKGGGFKVYNKTLFRAMINKTLFFGEWNTLFYRFLCNL